MPRRQPNNCQGAAEGRANDNQADARARQPAAAGPGGAAALEQGYQPADESDRMGHRFRVAQQRIAGPGAADQQHAEGRRMFRHGRQQKFVHQQSL